MSDSGTMILANARIVIAEAVIERGYVVVDNGHIVEVGEGSPPERGQDLGGSSAQSVILMIVVIALTFVQFRFIERRVHY